MMLPPIHGKYEQEAAKVCIHIIVGQQCVRREASEWHRCSAFLRSLPITTKV